MNGRQEFSWEWLAGFIDGEGCFIMQATNYKDGKESGGFTPVLSICQKDLALLEYIRDSIGMGFIPPSTIKRGYPYLYFTSGKLRKLLQLILPHLRLKRRQAEILLEVSIFNRNVHKQGRGLQPWHKAKLTELRKELNKGKGKNSHG